MKKVEKDNSDSSYQIYYFYVHIDLLMDCSFYMDTYGVSIRVKPFWAFIRTPLGYIKINANSAFYL